MGLGTKQSLELALSFESSLSRARAQTIENEISRYIKIKGLKL